MGRPPASRWRAASPAAPSRSFSPNCRLRRVSPQRRRPGAQRSASLLSCARGRRPRVLLPRHTEVRSPAPRTRNGLRLPFCSASSRRRARRCAAGDSRSAGGLWSRSVLRRAIVLLGSFNLFPLQPLDQSSASGRLRLRASARLEWIGTFSRTRTPVLATTSFSLFGLDVDGGLDVDAFLHSSSTSM